MQRDFYKSPSWRAVFRVPYSVLTLILKKISHSLEKAHTPFRQPILAKHKLAIFLLKANNYHCEGIAIQLGIGPSSITEIIRETSRLICENFVDVI